MNFINLSLVQHDGFLNQNIIKAVNEWIKNLEADGDKEEKIKGRMPREAGDRLTTLTLNQTALLIQFMQQTGIILKGEYLTYAQSGKAFNLLTGYSSHSIRQQLGTKGEIEGVKFEDYKELHQAMRGLVNLIETKIPKK